MLMIYLKVKFRPFPWVKLQQPHDEQIISSQLVSNWSTAIGGETSSGVQPQQEASTSERNHVTEDEGHELNSHAQQERDARVNELFYTNQDKNLPDLKCDVNGAYISILVKLTAE